MSEEQVDTLIHILSRDPDRLAQVIGRAGPQDERGDGWTPPPRRLFLSVLADTGRVNHACHWSSMSKQSAYQLRALLAGETMDRDDGAEQLDAGGTVSPLRHSPASVTPWPVLAVLVGSMMLGPFCRGR